MRPDATTKIATVTPKGGPNPVVIGAVIAIVLLVAVVVAVLIGNSSSSGPATGSKNAAPAGVVGGTGGGILVNAATAKSSAPTLDIFEDFQCPSCAQLEKKLSASITSMATSGQIRLVVHTLSFLDNNLKNDSSTRSANAAACAADAGRFLPFHAAVFAVQPAQEGAGYTDAQLTQAARTAGITGTSLTTWQKCTSSGQHAQYVTDVQTAAEKAGVFGTPTVRLNGKDISKTLQTAQAQEVLVGAVKAATQ